MSSELQGSHGHIGIADNQHMFGLADDQHMFGLAYNQYMSGGVAYHAVLEIASKVPYDAAYYYLEQHGKHSHALDFSQAESSPFALCFLLCYPEHRDGCWLSSG